jgi:hypothetical protein
MSVLPKTMMERAISAQEKRIAKHKAKFQQEHEVLIAELSGLKSALASLAVQEKCTETLPLPLEAPNA